MKKQRILLTGSSGMVGLNLIDHPRFADFDWLLPKHRDLDLSIFENVYRYVSEHQPDLVLHAAGKVGGIQANLKEPVSFLVENFDIGRNIVLACRQAGVKRIINLGSSCMYPKDRQKPLSEDQLLSGTLEPTNEAYALAKIATAKLCEYISRENACFQYKTLIPCNLYGKYDKFDPKCSHLIPAIIHKIHLAKKNKDMNIEIWGDGNARREFMYAGDFADALINSIMRFDELPPIMNIGLGYDFSINEYYLTTAEIMGYSGSFFHNLDRPVGMARKLVCTKKQSEWGWQAKSDLKAGISQTYQFYLREYVQ